MKEGPPEKLAPDGLVGPKAAVPNDDSIFGYMVGKAKIVGDAVSPISVIEDWEALK